MPDGTDDIPITAAAGAAYSNLTIRTGTEHVTYTFTVTAEDGTTAANDTVAVAAAADPAAGNKADVDAAKTIIENHTWTVPQATANTEEAVQAWIEGQLADMNLNGANCTVTMTGFAAADEGTSTDRNGTGGRISAAAYTDSDDGGKSVEKIPSDAAQGTWEPETASDGSISWKFKLADGSYAAGRWIKALWNGRYLWYYMDANGYLQSGWFTDTDGNIYYLHPHHDGDYGHMYTGDHRIDGAAYSFSRGREQDGLPEGALKQEK